MSSNRYVGPTNSSRTAYIGDILVLKIDKNAVVNFTTDDVENAKEILFDIF